MSYRNLAFERWKDRQIHGVGRYALLSDRTPEVYLYLTEVEAKLSAPFWNSKVYDLQPTPIPEHCPDRFYDREERRRERQEK